METLLDYIESDGLDYALRYGCTVDRIHHPELAKMQEKYIDLYAEIEKYIKNNVSKEMLIEEYPEIAETFGIC